MQTLDEVELHSLIAQYEAVSLSAVSIFVTVVFGFLAATYVIGDRLTKCQALLLGAAFLFGSFLPLYTAIAYSRHADRFDPDKVRENKGEIPDFKLWACDDRWDSTNATIVLGVLVIFTALAFLWMTRSALKRKPGGQP